MEAPNLLRVLNVENSDRDSSLIKRHLSKAGYTLEFQRVETRLEMKTALETNSWDVILVDYAMPHFSASQALEVLKESHQDIPFIVVSGTIGEERAVEIMRDGATDYVMKDKLVRLAVAIERGRDEVKGRIEGRRAESERVKLISEIQRQRDRLNTIIASVPGIVWEAWGKPDDANQRIDFVSDYVERMLGYSVEEWKTTPNFWLTIVHPDDREEAARRAAAYFSNKTVGLQSFRWIAKDGSVIWVESNSVTIVNEAGEPVGMRGVTLDISERRRAEATLRETEERFRRYFELGLIGMAITSTVKEILEVNDEFCAILGYKRSELLKKNWLELTHPGDRDSNIANFNSVMAEEKDGYIIQKRFLHKNGNTIYARVSVKFVRHSDEASSYFVALIQDITESRQAETDLRASEERYRQLFEGNPDPTFVFDQEFMKFLAVNEAAIQEYGYSREELLSLTSKDLWRPQDVSAFFERLVEMPLGPPRGSVWKNIRKDGTVIDVEITRRPLLFAGQQAWVMIAHNVTSQRILEEQFRHSQKMEAVGQLAGGIAHDFNNLLTVINGYSEFGLTKLKPEDPLRNDLDQILKAGERAASLTRQLLAFSRKQVLLPAVMDPNNVVVNLEKMLRRLIGENISLHTILDPNVGNIRADRGQLEQVIMNLVVNARDAMDSGGMMTIESQNVELSDDFPGHRGEIRPGPYVMLAVTDTGTGMDEKTKAQIFEPFFTTKEAGKGTGLGLSTVYGIIRQSEGSIRVYSEPGKGTTFKIYFPRLSEKPGSRKETRQSLIDLTGTETILLTEDDDAVRALAFKVLSAKGYKLLEASNGEHALTICRNRKDPIQLLITDVVMPQISGPDLGEQIRRICPEIKILFMSGYTDNTIVHQRILDEDTPFIQKPFTSLMLIRKVRDVLDSPLKPISKSE